MRILICIPCLLTGGTEIQTLNLVYALRKGGHEVITVCYFEYEPSMIRRYEEAGSEVLLMCRDGVRPAGVLRTVMMMYAGLKKAVRSWHPQVAHVQYMTPGAIPIVLLRLLGVKQIVCTAHTSADIYPSLSLLHFIQKHCCRVFTCITERAEQSFFGSSEVYTPNSIIGRHNHFTVYNSLPYGMQFETSPRCGKPTTIGVVSRLETIKGMDLVIPAFAVVKKMHPQARLIVVGDGSQKELMCRQAEEHGVQGPIEWTGRQAQESLHEWYGKMDIVLMPSRSEGFGLTAIEAMANGCVVVASNTGGLPEVVRDRESGLLHKTEDVADMATKINLLFDDDVMYAKLQKTVRPHAHKFSFERFSESFNSLYSRL